MQRGPTVLSLALALVVVSTLFWALDRWRPAARQARRATDTRTDLAYWFFTPLVTRAVTRGAIGGGFLLLALWQGVSLEDLNFAGAVSVHRRGFRHVLHPRRPASRTVRRDGRSGAAGPARSARVPLPPPRVTGRAITAS